MRNNILNLINSGISAHTVAKETGLPRNTVYRIFTGEAKLDNVTLRNAEVLSKYFEEDVKMENRTWERQNYEVDMVDHDYDLKAFEVRQCGMVTWTIVPSDFDSMKEIIEDLDNGADVEGWEDGNGNTVVLIEDTLESVQDYIRAKYLIDGESDKYSTLYYDKKEVLEEQDQDSFEEQFGVALDELKFPIITFDSSGAVDGWLFEETDEIEELLDRASEYFTEK